MNNNKPARHKLVGLAQLFNHIPSGVIDDLAKEYSIDKQARTFSPGSHMVAMMAAQFVGAAGLNALCDTLSLHTSDLRSIRGATAPSKNALSNANKVRSSKLPETTFWTTMSHLNSISPAFASGRKGKSKGILRRFKVRIQAVDSTVIELTAKCLTWAKHRRQKAAAKVHLGLDLHSFLPNIAIVSSAKEHDSIRAAELCAHLREGEIAIMDKGYVDFGFFRSLDERGVNYVTRAKENMDYEVLRSRTVPDGGDILSDEKIRIKARGTAPAQVVRRINARVEIDGEIRTMVFLTNNLKWAASSVCDLYKSRWEIEVFFKQIKQTLKLRGFLGNSANAIRWQIWTALLVYLLARYQAFLSQWGHSFMRIMAMIGATLWMKIDLLKLLRRYGCGTAPGTIDALYRGPQLLLPGFDE